MNPRFPLRRALLGALLILASAAALRALTPGYISAELAQRLLGVLLGVVVMVYANAVPKAYAPQRCSGAALQAARRFGGWSLTLGGLGYVLAWLLAPIGSASVVACALLGTSVLLAVLRFSRLFSRRT